MQCLKLINGAAMCSKQVKETVVKQTQLAVQLSGIRQVEIGSRSAKQSELTYNITGIDWAGQDQAGRWHSTWKP